MNSMGNSPFETRGSSVCARKRFRIERLPERLAEDVASQGFDCRRGERREGQYRIGDGKLGNGLDSQCRRAFAPSEGDLCKGLSTDVVDILDGPARQARPGHETGAGRAAPRHRGVRRAGVPVKIRSPGASLTLREISAMRSGTDQISSLRSPV